MTKYSNHNDASDDWFNLDDNFGPQGQWKRSYWDFVGVKNVRDDSVRGGVYVNARNTTVYITVYSLKAAAETVCATWTTAILAVDLYDLEDSYSGQNAVSARSMEEGRTGLEFVFCQSKGTRSSSGHQ